ncbi:MAG TPA: hypothetical protein VLT36_24580 [Candidatus Dormibacteraeota bacterium]|nr:hypothetical protein [Candidatus Dormibacteraeota bacterium]
MRRENRLRFGQELAVLQIQRLDLIIDPTNMIVHRADLCVDSSDFGVYLLQFGTHGSFDFAAAASRTCCAKLSGCVFLSTGHCLARFS